jgi:hypothetical protein
MSPATQGRISAAVFTGSKQPPRRPTASATVSATSAIAAPRRISELACHSTAMLAASSATPIANSRPRLRRGTFPVGVVLIIRTALSARSNSKVKRRGAASWCSLPSMTDRALYSRRVHRNAC